MRRGGQWLAITMWGLTAAAQALPTFQQVHAAYRPSDLPVLDRRGEPLQTLRTDARSRRLDWVALTAVSPALLSAIVHSEDRRFWAHSGVDWSALARSAWRNTLDQRTQGGSTLTMQLAGLLDADLAHPSRGARSPAAKLGQLVTAPRLEAKWSKSEILEAYLNLVPLRGELVGVNAATQTFFGKHPAGLDAQEAALLVALVRAPNAPVDRVVRRACALLLDMQGATRVAPRTASPSKASASASASATGTGTAVPVRNAASGAQTGASAASTAAVAPPTECLGLDARAALALARVGERPLGEQIAPHAARVAWQRSRETKHEAIAALATGEASSAKTAPDAASTTDGQSLPASLRTTLDARLQRLALRTLREHLAELQGRQVNDGAVLVLDNANGEVLAWVGSPGGASDRQESAPDVDAVLARRQPGSTLKPFIYELAFERRLLTPASLLHDAPAQLAAGNGLYLPQNYDRQHHGWVPARTALASSLNIPAVQVGAMLGPDALFERFNALGLAISQTAGYHGHALALGSAEVTLASLTNAYRALANGGRWSAWRILPVAPAAASESRSTHQDATRQVMPPAAAHLVTDILADNAARALTFGLDSSLVTRGFAAVKTGTSKDMRDNWCIGYTDRYTVGVWVGNAHGAPMQHVSGTTGAAPIWRALVARLHEDRPSRPPSLPAEVLTRQVQVNGQAPRRELFLAGTEPEDEGRLSANTQVDTMPGGGPNAGTRLGIRSPVSGSLFALDPDMPARVQRIVFDGEPGEWWLDDQRVGRTTRERPTLDWAPWPGRHTLQLRTAEGRALQAVTFEVRGATVREQAPAKGAQRRPAAGQRG